MDALRDYWYTGGYSWPDDYYMDEDERMAEYDNEVVETYNAEEDYWVGARYAREG